MSDWESLVEATIDAICVKPTNKEVRIEVTCAWEGKVRKQIVATGVDDLCVNEMRLSNVIDRVSRFDAASSKESGAELASRLFFLMRGKEPSPSDLQWPPLLEKQARIQDGSLGLLEIEPVYGGTVMIVAEHFRLEPLS